MSTEASPGPAPSSPAFFRILPGIQAYAWGKVGQASLAARLAFAADPSKITPDRPYAELWMGTHAALPSKLLSDPKTTLTAHLAAHPHLSPTPDLPFLLKVLSIQTALSIQAHPDRALAKRLHAERPETYKDPNHKPELAIALTDFEGFLGFRPWDQIQSFLESLPQFHKVCLDIDGKPPTTIKQAFENLMKQSTDIVTSEARSLLAHFQSTSSSSSSGPESELFQRLSAQYPDDVGLFCVFLLNIVRLRPGQAVFLAAGLIHAYISGDIVECMATSDNVIRAGLTPKQRDVPTLLTALSFDASDPHALTLPSQPFPASDAQSSKLFAPEGIEDFRVAQSVVQPGASENHHVLKGPSILLVTSGKGIVNGQQLKTGHVWFVGADTPLELSAPSDTEEPMVVFRAHA